MNIQQLRRAIRQESPSHLTDGVVVSVDSRGTRMASVRVSGGHVHSRVYICDETLGIGDRVVIARLEGLARQVVIGKIASQHGSSLSNKGVLAPPNNFTALTSAGVTYCQWDTYPGEDLSWEVQYSLDGSPYADATKVLVSHGSYYFYPCDPGTTVHFRARGIRWLGDNNLMFSGWSGWANATCADFEIPRLLVKLTNKAGKQVEEGWVVVIDTGNANSFKTTVTADDENVIGVAFETIADEAVGLICISGLVDVYVSDAPSIGDYLISSVTEGNATGSAASSKGCFGRALTTKAGNTVSAIIDPPLGAGAGVLVHNLLSAEHSDTLADAVVQGDMIVGSASPLWARLPKGAANLILKMNAGGTDPEWGEPPVTSIAGHVRGSIFRGEAADWGIYAAEADKQILVGDGTDIKSVPVSLDVTLANTGVATVVGIQGRVVGGGAPANGQVYAWNDAASEWQPVDQSAADLGIGGNPTFKADGVPIVISGVDGAYVCPGAGEIAAAYLHCAATGTISDVPNTVVDVNINGTTIFTDQTNRPMLAWNDADHVAKSGVPNVSTLAELDVLTVDIDQVATGASGLSVIISLAGGGGIIMIEIQEDDVKVADVTAVNFEGGGGKVTDEGGGKVTVDIAGAAPAAAKYAVTEAHGDLSAEIVLPQLGYYNPDTPPAAPGAYNDEFDNDAIDPAWTFDVGADAAFDMYQDSSGARRSEDIYHGFMMLQNCIMERAFTPSIGQAFTLVVKFQSSYQTPTNESKFVLAITGQSASHMYSVCVGRFNAYNQVRTLYNNGGGAVQGVLRSLSVLSPMYVMITHDGVEKFSSFVSGNGFVWYSIELDRAISNMNSFTKIEIKATGHGNPDPMVAVEFVRYFTAEGQYKIGKDV